MSLRGSEVVIRDQRVRRLVNEITSRLSTESSYRDLLATASRAAGISREEAVLILDALTTATERL